MKKSLYYFIVFIITLTASSSRAQTNRIKEFEKLLTNPSADTNRVHLLYNLSYQHYLWGSDHEKTRRYAEQCLQLASQIHYKYGMALGYNTMGLYYYKRNQNPKALQNLEKALQFYQQAGRKTGIAVIHRNIAMVMADMGNSAKAMEYYFKSIQIAEEIGNKEIVGNTFQSIGILMLNQKKYQDALKYLFQALPIQESLQDNRNAAITLNNIGLVYQQQKQNDKALTYLNRSLRLAESLGLTQITISCYNSLGYVNACLKRRDEAFAYYQKALSLAEIHGFQQSMSIALAGIGEIYMEKRNTNLAITFYKKSLILAETNQLAQQKLDAHQGLMATYALMKDYQQAYLHQLNVQSLKDSLFNKENSQSLAQLEASYEVEKKQAEIELLQRDQERARLIRNTILAGLFASLIIIGLIINRQRLKNRQNRLLTEKSEEISRNNVQLEQQAVVMNVQAAKLANANVLLEQKTLQLQQLNEVKSNFFNDISHEFRTPLTLILSPIERLKAGKLEAGQIHSYYQLIERNARQLLHLINQLLDYSKLEAGSMKVNMGQGDINQMLKATTFSFSSLTESKHIHLRFESAFKSIKALFDPDIMEKILNNLVSNAIKFTPPEGHIIVVTDLQKTQQTAATGTENSVWTLEIKVTDTGTGIPADQKELIFDRFFQVDGAQSDQQKGTGIGLALVKELVSLHKGTISVESELGFGATFTILLPLTDCTFEMDRPGGYANVKLDAGWLNNGGGLRTTSPVLLIDDEPRNQFPIMLIVEDNTDVREFIRDGFQDHFRVIEASNGSIGLQLARKDVPDIIITDRMMPSTDGVELCRQLKSDERTSHIPVVMLTAKASEASKIEGLSTGADDYILKPFSMQELTARVKNLVDQRKLLRERFTREVKLQPRDIAITSADEIFLQRAIGLIETHMSDTDFTVESFVTEIGMSRVQVHRKLKALTDQSTSEFIRSIRLKRAASLLEQNYGNVAEVMYEVGFNNVSYFASNFKKMYGVNPSDFRQQAIVLSGQEDLDDK